MFRAYDSDREQLTAVKLLKLDATPDAVHRIVAVFERVIAAELWHPALVLPIKTGVTGVDAFVATDYVAADSLDMATRERGPLAPIDAIRMAHDLGGALDVAATDDVLHGALHPRDVLISTDETRVTGLGVTQALEEAGLSAPMRRPYSAPERIAGDTEWDRRADVFSLAAIVYEALFARRIAGPGMPSGSDLPDVPGLDRDRLRRALGDALAENPDKRTPTAGHFVEALRRAVTDTTPAAPPRPRAPRSPRPADPPSPVGELPLSAASEPELPLDEPRFVEVDVPMARGPEPIVAAGPSVFDVEPSPTPSAAPVSEQQDTLRIWSEPDPRPVPTPVAPMSGSTLFGSVPESAPAHGPSPDPTLLEQSRSAVWPLGLALVIGVALGFAGGYAVALRDRPAIQQASLGGDLPAGRDFTESAIGEAGKASPPSSASESRPGSPARPEPPVPAATKSTGSTPPTPAVRGQTAQRAAAPAAVDSIGRISIQSTPAGADVSVDGRSVGRTPAAARDLSVGVHRVRVSRDGYTPGERQVVITRARPTQAVTVPLERVRAAAAPRPAAPAAPRPAPTTPTGTGTLVVDSHPPGAKVYLDGTLLGMTPVTLSNVNAGDHSVRLERDGFRIVTTTTRITPGQRARVAASMEQGR